MDANLLKMIRLLSGMNQTDFAEKVGYSRHSINQFETNGRPISKQFENKLKRTFDITEDAFRIIEMSVSLVNKAGVN